MTKEEFKRQYENLRATNAFFRECWVPVMFIYNFFLMCITFILGLWIGYLVFAE